VYRDASAPAPPIVTYKPPGLHDKLTAYPGYAAFATIQFPLPLVRQYSRL